MATAAAVEANAAIETSHTTTSRSRSARSPRRRQIRRITRPEPGSLYDILREHAGVALYVPPICWTDMHARLLGVKFAETEPVRTPRPFLNPAGNFIEPSEQARRIGDELMTIVSPRAAHPYAKTRAIKNLMSTLFPAPCSKPRSAVELSLWFGRGRFAKAVRLPVVWRRNDSTTTSFDSATTRPSNSFGKVPAGFPRARPEPATPDIHAQREWAPSSSWECPSRPGQNAPVLAYVDRTQLAALRRHMYRVVPGPDEENKANAPVANLQRLRSSSSSPRIRTTTRTSPPS